MSESTVVMPCNYTGLYDYDAYPELAKFGLVDYDWANAKSEGGGNPENLLEDTDGLLRPPF